MKDNDPDLASTVLLGFLKDGKYLLGYTVIVGEEDEENFGNMQCYYTLSLWQFHENGKPLTKVFNIEIE